MQNKYFADSNIFLYAFMANDGEKSEKAFSIIKQPSIILSTQVMNEICVNLIKKSKYTNDDIVQLVKNINDKYQVVTVDTDTILKAAFLRKSYNFSYWDSMIVSSALESRCSILYSEDMQNGQIIEKQFKIINPFL